MPSPIGRGRGPRRQAWEGLRVLSPDGCRPFSRSRNGMVMGEGAGVFVLEDRDHALARGAEIWAEVAGFAMTADASDIVILTSSFVALMRRLSRGCQYRAEPPERGCSSEDKLKSNKDFPMPVDKLCAMSRIVSQNSILCLLLKPLLQN